MINKKLLVFTLFFALIACSRISVDTDFDATHDFSRYRSYGWERQDSVDAQQLAIGEGRIGEVQSAIDRRMKLLGYKLVTDGKPDLLLERHGELRERWAKTGSGGGGGFGGRIGDPDYEGPDLGGGSESYRIAELTLKAIDSSSATVVWKGTVRGAVNEYAAVDSEIREFISTLMKDFPSQVN